MISITAATGGHKKGTTTMIVTILRTHPALAAASAAVLIALPVAVAPLAHADDQFGAISVSKDGTKSGVSSKQSTEDKAIDAATASCNAPDCELAITVPTPWCAAVGRNKDNTNWVFGQAPTKAAAEASATAQGAPKIVASVCAAG
jgi:Domain of unknown function (DUF4189)